MYVAQCTGGISGRNHTLQTRENMVRGSWIVVFGVLTLCNLLVITNISEECMKSIFHFHPENGENTFPRMLVSAYSVTNQKTKIRTFTVDTSCNTSALSGTDIHTTVTSSRVISLVASVACLAVRAGVLLNVNKVGRVYILLLMISLSLVTVNYFVNPSDHGQM
jgi:hypothetical protein